MARTGGGGEVLVKKNSKLEVFLKKALTENTFERIRGYESCIVVSEKENKAFKYVILGDEWIYLTENPAKTIQQAVWLGDIVSVDLVNDFPEFLSGDERENSQHLAIQFLTSPRRSTRKTKKVRNGSIADADRSTSTTPMGSYSEDFGYLNQSMSSLHGVPGGSRPSSRGSVTPSKDKSVLAKKKKTAGHDKVIGEERLEDIEEYDMFDRSANSEQIRKMGTLSPRDFAKSQKFTKNTKNGSNINGTARRLPQPPNSATEQPKKHIASESDDSTADGTSCCFKFCKFRSKSSNEAFMPASSSSRLKRNSIAPATPSELCFEEMGKDGYANRDDVSEIIEAPNIRKLSLASNQRPPTAMSGRDLPSARLTPLPSSRNSTSQSLRTSRNTTPFRDYEGKSLLMVPSGSDIGSMNGDVISNGVIYGAGDRRVVILNIYLLTLSSPMLMLIRSAWSNFLIRATLLLDPDFEKKAKSGAVRSSYNQVEKMDVLFVQLKRELFMPHNSLEDVYNLSNELRIAAERNFALRKIFWKNSDMFPFFVRHIQAFLPSSTSNHGSSSSQNQRRDEIELVILMTEIISMMFRETELIPARFQTLKSQRGKGVLDLLRVLTCTPEIQDKGTPPSGRAAELLRSFQEEGYSSSRETEVSMLLSEFTDVTMTAVFELFLMARQANWSHSADNFLNISWMVQVLEELSTTEKFVERVIKQMMKLISPSRVEELCPTEAVKLYRQFSVILTFLSYSPRVTFFIRNNYMEEFKYFVQPAVVERKLPANYPITRNTIQLIESVLSRVLNVPDLTLSKSPR